MARTFVAFGLFLATSIGFAGPAPAQYNPQSQYYNPQPQYNPQYNPPSQYNNPGTYQGYQSNQGNYPGGQQGPYQVTRGIIQAARKAITKATSPDAPMVSNSIPDRTVA